MTLLFSAVFQDARFQGGCSITCGLIHSNRLDTVHEIWLNASSVQHAETSVMRHNNQEIIFPGVLSKVITT